MKYISIACAGILATACAWAESRTVSTAADFVKALTDLNGTAANEIVLAADTAYDVSAYEMVTGYHLVFSKLTIRGASDNPRSVVIYGNFTKGLVSAGDGCKVHNVTFSNACVSSGSPFTGNWSHTAICSNVVFTCNQGSLGGAATMIYGYDCQFIGNKATYSAGAAFNSKGKGCKFIGNTAQRGGAISSNQNGYEFSNSLFEGNSTTDATLTYGGGAATDLTSGSYIIFRNCIFRNNTSASHGGAVILGRLLDHCIVSNNVAAFWGGGCYNCIVEDSDICFNRACNDSAKTSSDYYTQGGGICNTVATRCTIAGNAAYRTYSDLVVVGGGACSSVLTNCTIRDNFCKAAPAMQGGYAVGCVISNNASSVKGVTLRDVKGLENCYLHGVSVDAAGACFACTFTGAGSNATLAEGANVYTSGTFQAGNALFSTSQSSGMSATNCLFTGNTIDSFCYRGNDASKRQVAFVNCTIVSNRYDSLFSSLKDKPNTMLFENCIVVDNLNKNGTAVRNFYDAIPEDAAYVTVRNCMFGTGFATGWACPNESNVWTNDVVRFMGARDPAHPFALFWRSPARNKGLVQDWMTDAYDIRGDIESGAYKRLRDNKVDLGCYQCWLNPTGTLLMFR